MELKNLTEQLLQLLSIETVDQLPGRLLQIAQGQERDSIFDAYLELVDNDLSIDYLQRIHQFYAADRDEKKQDFTPATLAKLVAELTSADNESIVYDCCAGSGALTIQKWCANSGLQFICEELDSRVIPLLLTNLSIRNIGGLVINKDILTGEIMTTYRLVPGAKYADVTQTDDMIIPIVDGAISNPPYNIKWQPPALDKRFAQCLPPASNANYAFVLTVLSRLSDNGRAAIILPVGALTSKAEREARRYLVDSCLLECVILLPDNMFESTQIPTCVLLCSKSNCHPGQVLIIDAQEHCHTEVREQRGELHNTNRVYHKEVNILTDDDRQTILSALTDWQDVTGFCAVADADDIANNDYLLSPHNYIEMQIGEYTHRPYVDIIEDLRRIASEKNVVKITMNETLARDNGFADLAELVKKGTEGMEQINKIIKGLGCEPIEASNYVVLSKNKNEIKIENKSKENISSIFSILLPMWKQHLYYLNQRENEYLAELRDALLPELMSGRMDVSNFAM